MIFFFLIYLITLWLQLWLKIILFHRFLSLVLSYATFLLPALRCLPLPALIWGRRQWHPTPVLLPGKSHGPQEPRRLQSMGSLRVGHDWVTSLSLFTFLRWRRKWQPTPVSLPGESQGRGSLVGCRLWGHRVGHDWSDLAAAAAAPVWTALSMFTQ